MSLSDERLANIISELGSATNATPLTQFGKDALAMARELQQRRAYAKANPLGGPASMFRAIAERIEAGEEYWAVLRDYGVSIKEGK